MDAETSSGTYTPFVSSQTALPALGPPLLFAYSDLWQASMGGFLRRSGKRLLTSRLAVWSFPPYNEPPCEAPMPIAIRPSRRCPVTIS